MNDVPTFIEFLSAPWKLLSQLGLGSGGLCTYQDVGGQLLHVCSVGGYVMPSFIFWACLLILLLFLAGSFTMHRQCVAIAKTLREITEALAALPEPKTGYLGKNDLSQLRKIIGQQKLTGSCWKQFEDGLLLLPESDEIFTTDTMENTFSKASIVEDNVYTSLYSAIPGVLTGVGLLMTFVAILDGLAHVSVSSNMDVTGIGGLINGLSGKFASSIVAVGCAVCFTFVERYAYAQPTVAHRKLITFLSSRFRRKTVEHLLQSIHEQLAISQGRSTTTARASHRAQPVGD